MLIEYLLCARHWDGGLIWIISFNFPQTLIGILTQFYKWGNRLKKLSNNVQCYGTCKWWKLDQLHKLPMSTERNRKSKYWQRRNREMLRSKLRHLSVGFWEGTRCHEDAGAWQSGKWKISISRLFKILHVTRPAVPFSFWRWTKKRTKGCLLKRKWITYIPILIYLFFTVNSPETLFKITDLHKGP